MYFVKKPEKKSLRVLGSWKIESLPIDQFNLQYTSLLEIS
jgi:hypothetical protein